MEIKKVSIIGQGALGILFGHQMRKHMPKEDLRFIADAKRIARYTREGVYCNGERCDFEYVAPDAATEPADLLLFAVKYNALRDAVAAAENHVGPNTIILSLLNGISSEGIIAETYGMEHILYCVAQGMDAMKEGNALTYHNMGLLSFGSGEQAISEKAKTVDRFFTKMEIPHEIPDDMKHRMWGKFMTNVGVNQTSAVYGCNYGCLQAEGPARDMMILAMREVMALSALENVALTEDDLSYWLNVLSTLSIEGKPSMRQDVEAKRLSEVELFAGTVLAFGKKHNYPTPVNQIFYDKMLAMETAY